jgi:hypothetical protein
MHQIKWSILFSAPSTPLDIAALISEYVAPVEIEESKKFHLLLRNLQERVIYLNNSREVIFLPFQLEKIKEICSMKTYWISKLMFHGEFITFPEITQIINWLLNSIEDVDTLAKFCRRIPPKINETLPIEYN